MRDNLHGFAEIVASAFFVEYVPIYLTRGKIGKLVELNIYKSLVVSQWQWRQCSTDIAIKEKKSASSCSAATLR